MVEEAAGAMELYAEDIILYEIEEFVVVITGTGTVHIPSVKTWN